MAKYINKFDTLEDYNAALANLDYPSINYIAEYDELKWDEELPPYKVLITNLDGSTALYVPFDENDTVIHQNDIVGINNDGSYDKFLIGEGVTAADDNIFSISKYTSLGPAFKEMYIPSTFDQETLFPSNICAYGYIGGLAAFGRKYNVGIRVDDITIADGANLYSLFQYTNITSLDLSDFDADGKTTSGILYGASDLESITLPSNLDEIGCYAFSYCSGLTSVNIPDSVTSIGGWAFIGCTSLTSVTIPTSVTSIGENAFELCSSLSSITIPSGVTNIGNLAFVNATNLQSITIFAATPPALGSDVFYNTNECPIYVPSGSVNTYKAASGWSDYASRIMPSD